MRSSKKFRGAESENSRRESERERRNRTDQHRINPQSCLSWSRCDTSRHKETSLFREDGSASSADTRALVLCYTCCSRLSGSKIEKIKWRDPSGDFVCNFCR